MKKKLIIITAIIFLAFIGWKALNIYVSRQFMYAAFPFTQVVFETNMEPVDIYVGDVHYRVPKAYLYWPAHMDGGKLSNFSMRANIDEGMIPWTVSQNYKNRVKEGRATIDVTWASIGMELSKIYDDEIKHILEQQKNSFADRYKEVEYGTYKNIFSRYNTLGKIGNTNKEGIGSIFYLVPKVKTEKPFSIYCPLPENPQYLCTVRSLLRKDIGYSFMIPLSKVDQYIEWDQKVQNLIQKLIVKE